MRTSDSSSSDERAGEPAQHRSVQYRVGADPTHGWRKGARGELRKSCDTCTWSKTKCCGGIPCDRCKKRGINCKFSKRRRCGPKTRIYDEKRPRSGPSDESDSSSNTPGASRQPSHHYPPVRTIGSEDTAPTSDVAIPADVPRLLLGGSNNYSGVGSGNVGNGGVGNGDVAPAADGLSELVELLAPCLSDGGGSASSFRSPKNAGKSASASARLPVSYALSSDPAKTVRGSHPRGSRVSAGVSCRRGENGSSHREGRMPRSTSPTPMDEVPPSRPEDTEQRQGLFGSSRPGFGFPSTLPQRENVPVVGGPTIAPSRAASNRASMAESSGLPVALDAEGWIRSGAGSSRGQVPVTEPQPSPRGPLPMDLDACCVEHLATFMRIIGSVVLLPGTDDFWEAIGQEMGEAEESEPPSGGAPLRYIGRGHLHPAVRGARDGMGDAVQDIHLGTRFSSKGRGKQPRSGRVELEEQGCGILDELASARRAEAWAAIAVGAVFHGSGMEEAEEYAFRAQSELSRCLDVALPEVASVMILLSLFWMHSTNTRKVMRYFGFAQQIAVELGDLMPGGLLYSMLFVSSLLKTTVDPAQAESHGVQIRDPAAWGVAAQSTPGAGRLLRALAATTLASSSTRDAAEVLQEADTEGTAGSSRLNPRRSPLNDWFALNTPGAQESSSSPPPPPGQSFPAGHSFDSHRVLRNIALANDWIRQPRPVSSTVAAAGVVPHVAGGMGAVTSGPLPSSTPRHAVRHAPEPVGGLELPSRAALLGVGRSSSRCVSHEGVGRSLGGGTRLVGRDRGYRGSDNRQGDPTVGGFNFHAYDESLPPVNPLISRDTSFDPHEEDLTFQEMVFPFPPET